MDILSHTLSGTAAGTVVAAHSKGGFKTKAAIILFGTLGGALPDIDAISYWSKFDATFGRLFGLEHSGRVIYGAKFWYSHHAALHSITAALGLPLLFLFLKSTWLSFKAKNLSPFPAQFKRSALSVAAFALGFCMHLLEDMPTPASVWGGVNLFWPSTTYIGGFGKIWWWNNYDVFLLIVAIIPINLVLHLLHNWFKFRLPMVTKIVFATAAGLILYQMNTRPVDFSYTGNTHKYGEFESESKAIQKEVLGPKLYHWMEAFDNAVPLNF